MCKIMSVSPFSTHHLVKKSDWKRGLRNLQQGEYSAWFKSSKWWKHIVLWIMLVNLMMVIMVLATKEAPAGEGLPVLYMYGIFGGMFVAFGVMIIMQRVIVGEKKSGKFMRRVLASISNGRDVGNVTTLANPDIVEEIRKMVQGE